MSRVADLTKKTGLPEDFDVLGAPSTLEGFEDCLPTATPDGYKPSNRELVLATAFCAGKTVTEASRLAGISHHTYYRWRKQKEGFAQWLDAYVEAFHASRARRVRSWLATEVLGKLERMFREAENTRDAVAAARAIRDLAQELSPKTDAKTASGGPATVNLTIVELLEQRQHRRRAFAAVTPPIAGVPQLPSKLEEQKPDDDGDRHVAEAQ